MQRNIHQAIKKHVATTVVLT